MKTSILLSFISLLLIFLSCEKKSSDLNKVDTLKAKTFNSQPVNEESISILKSLNRTDLLTTFFNPYKISNDTALWNADLESLGMNISDYNYRHTVVDTIFDLGTSYIILFSTYETMQNGEPHGCHPCNVDYSIANVSKVNNQYRINAFKKFLTTKGSMGQGAYLTLVQFKYDKENPLICLKFEDGWIGGGAIMEAIEYFNIEDFSSLLYVETHNSNEGMCEETDVKCIDKTEREIIPFEKHVSKQPAIIINYKHTYYDKKLIIIEKSDTLIYDGYHFNKDMYYEGV
jgi:hypothetical protein